MKVALTGSAGLVGQFVAAHLLARGDALVALGRPSPHGGEARPWRLGEPAPLQGCDALVHCAFAHAPGRYRGGEGDDPAGFRKANLDGTLRLWEDAAGLHSVFLSSRAVYDGLPPGTALTEDAARDPATLYGAVKLAGEPTQGASLRATGVYGPPAPGQRHKWADLFHAFARGEAIPPAIGSEVHGADVAAAVALLLDVGAKGPFNCTDLLLDRRDLLAMWGSISGVRGRLPVRPDGGPGDRPALMDAARLRALGWRPGGWKALESALRTMAA